MQNQIPLENLKGIIGPMAQGMLTAVDACVHCGFCLPVCPTYRLLGEEMDSPRGRIMLMKTALEGRISIQETLLYIDRCLGCQACTETCPSGVRYGELVIPFKAYAAHFRKERPARRTQRLLVRQTLPHPSRFRLAAAVGKFVHPLQAGLPGELRSMLEMLPEQIPAAQPLPEFYPAVGKSRARVILLTGCVQQVLDPGINWATLRVLAQNGVDVIIPKDQSCCGAILMHTGDLEAARSMAKVNFAAFSKNVDAIITNAAGCGSGMKEYDFLFAGLEQAEQAAQFASKVKDVTVFLAELGLRDSPKLAQPIKVAYHDACHLAHAQGVRDAPRALLKSIQGLSLIEITESDLCCGSAGTYNLEQPEIAAELGQRKADNIRKSGASLVVMGNIGCMVQIRKYLSTLHPPIQVCHTIELLDKAYNN